jgi:hypothetical protein
MPARVCLWIHFYLFISRCISQPACMLSMVGHASLLSVGYQAGPRVRSLKQLHSSKSICGRTGLDLSTESRLQHHNALLEYGVEWTSWLSTMRVESSDQCCVHAFVHTYMLQASQQHGNSHRGCMLHQRFVGAALHQCMAQHAQISMLHHAKCRCLHDFGSSACSVR